MTDTDRARMERLVEKWRNEAKESERMALTSSKPGTWTTDAAARRACALDLSRMLWEIGRAA